MSNDASATSRRADMPETSQAGGIASRLLRDRVLDAPPQPGLIGAIDRFKVHGVLGEGGMGVVLLACDPATDTNVAIKVLRPELARDAQIVRRFLAEARHMYKLDHGAILRVLEVSDRAAGPYYVMPYKERGSLARLISPGRPLDSDAALGVARNVAEALAHAHAQGLIHRDVKPHNILLDADGRAYLADFGLARTVFNDSLVEPGKEGRLGTVAYMSPAVARGQAEDTRCDIYSFGAVLYEMLTGEPPYSGQSREAILNAILAGPPTPILKRQNKAHAGLAAIAEGCMARELRDRHASMSDVVVDLERVKQEQRPLGPGGRAVARRNRGLVRIGGAALIALAVAGAAWRIAPLLFGPAATQRSGPEVPLPGVRVPSDPELARILAEWPESFADPLTDPACLSRAVLAYGTSAGEKAFSVAPGVGLETRGFLHSIAWWNTLVGTRYALTFEFRPEHQHNRMLVVLNGPGYGTSEFFGYQLLALEDKKRMAVRCGFNTYLSWIDLPPLSPRDWHSLAVVREDDCFRVWLNGRRLTECRGPSLPDDPLHRFVGLGSGAMGGALSPITNQLRNLVIRMPREELVRLGNLPVARPFDLPQSKLASTAGEIDYQHDFADDFVNGRSIQDLHDVEVYHGLEGVLLSAQGLELNGDVFLRFHHDLPRECIAEFDWRFLPAPAGVAPTFIRIGQDRGYGAKKIDFEGFMVGAPNQAGDDLITWAVTRGTFWGDRDFDDHQRSLADSSPSYCSARGRDYTIRIEIIAGSIRVFVNGSLSTQSGIPAEYARLDPIRLAISTFHEPRKVLRAVRIWRPAPAAAP